MKKYYYLVFLVLIFLGCKEKKVDFNMLILGEKESSEIINLGNYSVYSFKYIKEIDSNLIYTNDSILIVYNLQQKKIIKSIELPSKLYDIYCHNLDSIFVLVDPYHTNKDSIICLIDSNGSIIHYYPLDKPEILDTNFNLKAYPNDLVFVAGKLYVSLKRSFTKLVGDEFFLSNKTPLVAFFNKNNNLEFIDLYDYPYLSLENQFAPGFFKQNIQKFDNENILLSFSYTPEISKINCKTGKIQRFYVKSYVLDTLPLRQYLTMTQPFYHKIIVSNESDLIFRRIVYSVGKGKIGYLYFNKDFERIGEFVTPEKTLFAFAKNEKLYFFDVNNKEHKVYLSSFSYKFEALEKEIWLEKNELLQLKQEIIAECQVQTDENTSLSCNLLPYLEKQINDSSYSVVIVPIQFACTGCIDYSLMQYSVNQDYYSDKKVYLIGVGEGGENVKSKLSEASIDIQNKYIIIDSTADYFNYQKGYTNIQYLIVKNKEIIFNRIYKPEELNDWAGTDLENYFKTFEEQ